MLKFSPAWFLISIASFAVGGVFGLNGLAMLAEPCFGQQTSLPVTPVIQDAKPDDHTDDQTAREQEMKVVEKYAATAHERWEETIARLESKDALEQHPDDSILFLGSSSVRLWETIGEDVAPWHPIQRGYGGAKFSDLAVFADRLIRSHRFQAVVIFVANDVTGKQSDPSTYEIKQLVRNVLRTIRKQYDTVPIFLVEITPTESRFQAWDEICDVNSMLRELALTSPNTWFVETAEHYLDENKRPISQYFRDDGLHQNREGYKLWGKLIKRELDDVLDSR